MEGCVNAWKNMPELPLVYWKPRLGSPARGRNYVIQPKFPEKKRLRPVGWLNRVEVEGGVREGPLPLGRRSTLLLPVAPLSLLSRT